jgi:Patatin-like phospholipase
MPKGSLIENVIGYSVGAIAFLASAYFAWYLIPGHLWHWANEAWWHWGAALPAYLFLFIAPFWTFGARSLVGARGAGPHGREWWPLVGYSGTAAVMLLLLWGVTPQPAGWVSRHWWLWGAAVIGAAVVGAAGWMFFTVQNVDATLRHRKTFQREWRFNHGDKASPPALGIAMSGGGIRSAAFNIGVLQALHEQQILRTVDVMSAVSGGSYAMSWYLLLPFYAAQTTSSQRTEFKLDAVIDEMLRPEGRFNAYLCRDPCMVDYTSMAIGAAFDATFFQPLRALAAATGALGQYNGAGGVRAGYRDRIQELFQGLPASDPAHTIANRIDPLLWQELNLDSSTFSCVMPVRYQELAEFASRNGLPFFIFNGAVLVERDCRHMLWPTAFELTADEIGSDLCGYRKWDELKDWDVSEQRRDRPNSGFWKGYGQLLTHRQERHPNRWIFMVNLAPAISGAALGLSYFDPKKQSRGMRLATWTPFGFNFDLGYLFPRAIWNEDGALYVSDGGHSENLGAYALIKRQCRRIIIIDAEHEKTIPYGFGSYSKLKQRLVEEERLCLAIPDIDSYLVQAKAACAPTGPSPAVMTGHVSSLGSDANARPISVVYIKLGLDSTRLDSYPPQVSNYARKNERFPQDPTSNQIFSSEQFVAYRALGHHVAARLDELMKVG